MNETKKEIKRMFDGMLFHCMDMTEYMRKHNDDPYFKTEEGKKIMNLCMKICLYHSMGCMAFITEDHEEDEEPKSLEDILKGMIDI